MYTVKYTSAYKKAYKLMVKRGLNVKLLDDVVEKLMMGVPLEKKYCDHSLGSNWDGFRECHIKPDWILLYYIDKGVLTLTLVNTGTHNEVLGV